MHVCLCVSVCMTIIEVMCICVCLLYEFMCVSLTDKHAKCHTLVYIEVGEAWTFPQCVLILHASAACVPCVRPCALLVI